MSMIRFKRPLLDPQSALDPHGSVPINALLDRNGIPILDRDGNYILTR
jgi:hypothetical protein